MSILMLLTVKFYIYFCQQISYIFEEENKYFFWKSFILLYRFIIMNQCVKLLLGEQNNRCNRK